MKSRLEPAPFGHGSFRPPLTRLHVDDDEIDRHVFEKLDETEGVLIGRDGFGDVGPWPVNAQLATPDMCRAMGPKLGFPKFQGNAGVRNRAGAVDERHFTPDAGTIRIRDKSDRAHFPLALEAESQGLPLEQIVLELVGRVRRPGTLLALHVTPLTQGEVKEFQRADGLVGNGAFDDPGTRSELASRLSAQGFVASGA